ERNRALSAMAAALRDAAPRILAANAADMRGAERAGLSAALLDRLMLDRKRLDAMADGVQEVTKLPDPTGQEPAVTRRPHGLVIRKLRVPLGVIAVIYEARPNVTADAAGLCLKAGNAVILRGGSEAQQSNAAIFAALCEGARAAGLPGGALGLVAT